MAVSSWQLVLLLVILCFRNAGHGDTSEQWLMALGRWVSLVLAVKVKQELGLVPWK